MRPSDCTSSLRIVSMTMSQSAARYWMGASTQATSRETPSSRARARAISIWKPGGLSARLAKGSALGCAQTRMTPRASIDASGRATAGIAVRLTAARTATASAAAALRRTLLESANIRDDGLDLVIRKTLAECRHSRRFAILDLLGDVLVGFLCPHELRSAALHAAALLV